MSHPSEKQPLMPMQPVTSQPSPSYQPTLHVQQQQLPRQPQINGYDADLMEEPQGSTSCSVLAGCLQAILCPLTFGGTALASCLTVPQQSEAVIMRCGKYEQTITEPGLHCSNVFGRTVIMVSKQIQSVDLPSGMSGRRTVLDADGNPLIVSAVCAFRIQHSYRAVINVDSARGFLMTQGETVLKNVVSSYPYECDQRPSLRTHSDEVSLQLKNMLQSKVSVAGVEVISFDLKEVSYAPVVAAAMLKRQQANAIIGARQAIVTGAVDIATHAVRQLEQNGISMSETDNARLVSNLLTVICSEADVTPTVSMSQ
eukprot:m.11012 g.11012  ORF g.11012 m.11012 type:complete len:313 (+) comp5652_c0_seq1:406-1344(+)